MPSFAQPTIFKWAYTSLCTLHSKFCSSKWNKVTSYKMILTNKNSKKCQMTYIHLNNRKTLKRQVNILGWQGCQEMDALIYQGRSLNQHTILLAFNLPNFFFKGILLNRIYPQEADKYVWRPHHSIIYNSENT